MKKYEILKVQFTIARTKIKRGALIFPQIGYFVYFGDGGDRRLYPQLSKVQDDLYLGQGLLKLIKWIRDYSLKKLKI